MIKSKLIGKKVFIKDISDYWQGHWGYIKMFDGRFYHIGGGSIGDMYPVFTRDEFTIKQQ